MCDQGAMNSLTVTQPLAGLISDGVHRLQVRVYYEDTDFTGVVYHANYLKFLERGRSDFLRLMGIAHHEMARLSDPLAFAVSDLHILYKRPARIDDLVEVRTEIKGLKGAQVLIEQGIEREGQTICTARLSVVLIDAEGRPRRIPEPARSLLTSVVNVKSGGENAP